MLPPGWVLTDTFRQPRIELMARALSTIVTCESCEAEYDGLWPAEEEGDEQDRAEAPVARQECPVCGHTQEEEYPGWSFQGEAG